jgi:hypothetical protein
MKIDKDSVYNIIIEGYVEPKATLRDYIEVIEGVLVIVGLLALSAVIFINICK